MCCFCSEIYYFTSVISLYLKRIIGYMFYDQWFMDVCHDRFGSCGTLTVKISAQWGNDIYAHFFIFAHSLNRVCCAVGVMMGVTNGTSLQ